VEASVDWAVKEPVRVVNKYPTCCKKNRSWDSLLTVDYGLDDLRIGIRFSAGAEIFLFSAASYTGSGAWALGIYPQGKEAGA
jgi:hypothetical protein